MTARIIPLRRADASAEALELGAAIAADQQHHATAALLLAEAAAVAARHAWWQHREAVLALLREVSGAVPGRWQDAATANRAAALLGRIG